MKDSLISVVIPIYNVEKYLERCIDSVINQTYQNLEIILINDGSPDGCATICEKYEVNDKRVKIIKQKNKGLAETRNIGINHSTAEYLIFIDSDDYINKDMIKTLYENLITHKGDISSCGHYQIYNNNIEKNTHNSVIIELTSEEALKSFLYTHIVDVVTWNKLYKKELFKDIRFPKGKLYEDHYTIYKILDKADKIIYNSTPLYYYCKRDTSIGGCSFNKRLFELEDALVEECGFIIQKYPSIEKEVSIARITWLLVIYNKMILSNHSDILFTKKIEQLISQHLYSIIRSKELYITNKLQILIFAFNKRLYKFVYKKYVNKYRKCNE